MNKSLPELIAAGTLDGTEDVLINQAGNPRRTSVQSIANLGGSGPATPKVALNLMDFIPNTAWSGIEGYDLASEFDCLPYMNAAIAALPRLGGVIVAPAGFYYFSDTIRLSSKPVHLYGAGGGEAGAEVTRFAWAINKTGILVFYDPTTGASGSASIIEGLYLTGAKGTNGHGVHMRERATIRECQIGNFGECGIFIGASVGGDPANIQGNANNWFIARCRVATNVGHGFQCTGSDVNAGNAVGLSASGNGGYGILDDSFLGNTFTGCHTETNTLGAYACGNPNARSVFVGCYSEQDQPPSAIFRPATVVGGLHAAGFTPDSTAAVIIGTLGWTPFTTAGMAQGTAGRAFNVGYNQGGAAETIQWSNPPDGGFTDELLVRGFWNDQNLTLRDQLGYGNSENYMLCYTNSLSAVTDAITGAAIPGRLVLPTVYYQSTGNPFHARKISPSFDSAAPTSGTWNVGDLIYNTAPTAGGGGSPYIGWVCTTAGTAGVDAVFKTFGAVSA